MRTSTKTKSERIKRHQGNLDYQLEGVVQNVLRINNNNIRKYRTGNTNNDKINQVKQNIPMRVNSTTSIIRLDETTPVKQKVRRNNTSETEG